MVAEVLRGLLPLEPICCTSCLRLQMHSVPGCASHSDRGQMASGFGGPQACLFFSLVMTPLSYDSWRRASVASVRWNPASAPDGAL